MNVVELHFEDFGTVNARELAIRSLLTAGCLLKAPNQWSDVIHRGTGAGVLRAFALVEADWPLRVYVPAELHSDAPAVLVGAHLLATSGDPDCGECGGTGRVLKTATRAGECGCVLPVPLRQVSR